MGRLHMTVLGTPVICHDERILTFPTRKAMALLIYLAVEGGLHTREKITALLWPESDEEHGRRSLRNTLTFLRRLFPEGAASLRIERDRLGLADAELDLDLHAFQAAYALAREPERGLPEGQIARLQTAASLYRGDFLEGFTIGDAPAFDDWMGTQREMWHRRAELVFERLAQELSDGGDLQAALEATARWVGLDPLNEAAHRRLMRLHFTAGDRAAALQSYAACRAILAAELDAEPAPETEALAERIRTVPAGRARPRSRRPAPRPVTVEGPLVGRLSDHARLAAAFRAARRGQLGMVIVSGEPGIGKTRLTTDFLRWVAAQGADVLHGRAFETGRRLPYHPLVEALRRRLADEGDLRSLLGDIWLADLSRLLPEIRERYPDLPAPLSEDPEGRTRLFEAVARLVRSLAERAPVVLYIDDLHWADAASLDVVAYAARRWVEARTAVLLVASLRSDELDTNPTLAEWLAGLGRDMPVMRHTLDRLSEPDTRRLAATLVSGDRGVPPAPLSARRLDDEAFGHWLYAETGGSPLFIVETMRSLVERSAVRHDETGAWILDGESMRGPVAPRVQEVIRARLARLGAPARAILAAGAILGDDLEFHRLCRVAGLGDDEALGAVDQLLARQVLSESETGYLFGHDKIREVVYADVGVARRRVLHRRAVEVLEGDRAPAAALARHALAAGLHEQALRFSIAAGDDAMRLSAVRDAIRHYEQALQLLPAQTSSSPALTTVPDLQHLYAQAGKAYEVATQYAQARATYEALLALARERGDPSVECAALNRLATVAAHELRFDQQESLLQQAMAVARTGGNGEAMAETEWNLARLTFMRADFAAARLHGHRALDLARGGGRTEAIARSLNWLALANLFWGHWREAQAYAEEGVTQYAALGDRAMEADCLVQLAGAQIRCGHTQDGIAAARAACAIGREIDNPWTYAAAARELAAGLLDAGAYMEALAVAQEGVAAARQAGYPFLVVNDLTILGTVYRWLGALDTARSAHREALAVAESIGNPAFVELVADELCADEALRGDWTAAQAAARRALALRDDAVLYGGLSRWYETEALVCAGDVAAAADDVRRFGARIGDNLRYRIPYLRSRAVLAASCREIAQATAYLQEAASMARSLDLPGEAWSAEAALGHLCREHGQESAARQAYGRSADIVQALATALTDETLRDAFVSSGPIRHILAAAIDR